MNQKLKDDLLDTSRLTLRLYIELGLPDDVIKAQSILVASIDAIQVTVMGFAYQDNSPLAMSPMPTKCSYIHPNPLFRSAK